MAVRKDGIKSKDKLLEAATEVFAEKGFREATILEISKRAQCNVAAINYHFKSKEALYERIVSDLAGMIYERVVGVIAEESGPREQLYSIIHRYIETLTIVDRNMLRTMLREIAGGGKFFKKLAIPRLVLPVISKIEPILRLAQERGELRRDLDPLYTFMQIIGGIIFFNIIQIPMQGTVIEKLGLRQPPGGTVFSLDEAGTALAGKLSASLLTALAAGGLDCLPHGGAVITLLQICNLKHGDSYLDIFTVSVVGPIIASRRVATILSFYPRLRPVAENQPRLFQ